MDIVTSRCNDILWNINQNPVSIFITRTEKTRSGGGFTETKSSIGPFTVRIYQQKSSSQQEVSSMAGTKQKNPNWGMLADYQSDIKAGTNVTDEFDALGGHFKVTTVNPQYCNNQIIGYQCDLEQVM